MKKCYLSQGKLAIIVVGLLLIFNTSWAYYPTLPNHPVGVLNLPTVLTTAVSTVSSTSATLGGDVTSNGGVAVTDRGVVYSITAVNANPEIGGTGVTQDTNGDGIGLFSESVSGLTSNSNYSVKAYAINLDGTSYGSVQTFTTEATVTSTFESVGTGNWSDPTNWSDGVPGSITNATIGSGTAVVDGYFTCMSLTINSGTKVSINPQNTLTVTGQLTNSAGTTGLVLESDASGTGMIMNNSTGVEATIEQYFTGGEATTGSANQWHYISIPIAGTHNVEDFFNQFYVIKHTETDNSWTYLADGDQLTVGKGYGVWSRNATNTVSFIGTFNSGDKSFDLSYTSELLGWNFVGNPYPVTIDWDLVQENSTHVENGLFIWNPTLGSNTGDYGNYGTYSNGVSANGQTQYIPPMQGFIVRTNALNPNLSILNSNKTTNVEAFKSQMIDPIIRLAITDNGINFDEFIIRVSANSNPGFDRYDCTKLKALNTSQPLLYSVDNGKEKIINSIPEITDKTVIRLEVMAKQSGMHQLVLKELENYSDDRPIILFDQEGKQLVNLLENQYEFNANGGSTQTFFLTFNSSTAVGAKEILASNILLSTYGNELVIDRLQNIPSEVIVCNVSGQNIYRKKLTTDKLTVNVPKTDVYLVKVVPENGSIFNGKAFISF